MLPKHVRYQAALRPVKKQIKGKSLSPSSGRSRLYRDDSMLPKHVRYQAALRPVKAELKVTFR